MNRRPKIVYPDADPEEAERHHRLFDRLREFSDFRIDCGRPGNRSIYQQRIRDADGILLGWDLPGAVMRAAKNLRIVSFTGIGAEKFVDIEQASERAIVVTNCPGYADHTVAEHTLALLLSLVRHVPRLDRTMRTGFWNQTLDGMQLRGKQIGLIGFGGIGVQFSRLCQALGMRVKVWTRTMHPDRALRHNVEFVSLEQMYAECDVISLHLASTEDTRQCLNQAAFEQMRPGMLIINTARGELIDEAALLDALQSGRIGGAALDVFVNEPLATDHPLMQLDNVILTPHIAYNTPESTEAIFTLAIDNLVRFFQGNPVHQINPIKPDRTAR